jgi:ABC-type transport system involved in multi-copper enzyme maturation permease subunit
VIAWIARRELLEHVRSARFSVLSLLCVLLLPALTYVNVTALRARETFARELEEARLIGSDREGALHDQGASRFGWRSGVVAPDPALRAVRPPQAEEVLAQGASGATPAYWQFSTEGLAEGPPADAQERQSVTVGAMDIASLVQTVLGLLAVLVAFDSVSGELESGRMRTILAHPVSRAEVLAGKFIGAYASLTVPLMVGMSASYLVMWLRGLPVREARFVGATAGIVVASLLYLATMLALGIAASALTREARTSLVVLLVIWICTTLAVPSAAVLASAAASPVQPVELMRASITGNMRQLERERAQRLAEIWEAVAGSRQVPADGVLSPELRERYAAAVASVEQSMTSRKRQVIESLEGARERQLERQTDLQTAIGRLSPAVTFLRGAEALAGTGASMQRRWRREVGSAQHALEAATFDRHFGVELYAAEMNYERITYWPDPTDVSHRVPDYDELPAFAHRRETLLDAVTASAPDLCLLAVECVGLMVVAAFAYFRVDV